MMLPPIQDADWPEALAHLRSGFTGKANVYRTMAHHPALLAAWQDLRAHVVTKSALDPQALEVVIYRTGHRLGAEYERAHHIVRAREAGMSDDRIASLEGDISGMNETDAPLAAAVDALLDEARLSAELQGRIVDAHGVAGLLDLMATVGFYSTLAFIVNSFDTPLDADIVEALRARPLGADASRT